MAETLLSLGITPVGLAESRGYRKWVSIPPLPEDVADVGLRSTPSLETIAALQPDLILSTPQFAAIEPVLAKVAPVFSFGTFTQDMTPLRNAAACATQLGEILRVPRKAAALIAETEQILGGVAEIFHQRPSKPVLVANFHDTRHLWIHTSGSLFSDVLQRVGLVNAWKGPGNAWGITNATFDQLIGFDDVSILVVEPVPIAVQRELEARDPDTLIGALPAFHPGQYRILPPNWAFGGLRSASRFAEALRTVSPFLMQTHAG